MLHDLPALDGLSDVVLLSSIVQVFVLGSSMGYLLHWLFDRVCAVNTSS